MLNQSLIAVSDVAHERGIEMPSIDKAERRDKKRRKEREGKFQGVRYGSERTGEGLVAFETLRKTKIEGKPAKTRKRRGMRK